MIEDIALHVLAYKWEGLFTPFSLIFTVPAESHNQVDLTPKEGWVYFLLRFGGYTTGSSVSLDVFYKSKKVMDTISNFPDVNTYFHLPNIFSNVFDTTVTFDFSNSETSSVSVCFHGVVLAFREEKAKGFLEDVKALAEIPKDIKETNRLLEELNDILKGIIARA